MSERTRYVVLTTESGKEARDRMEEMRMQESKHLQHTQTDRQNKESGETRRIVNGSPRERKVRIENENRGNLETCLKIGPGVPRSSASDDGTGDTDLRDLRQKLDFFSFLKQTVKKTKLNL